MAKRKYTVLTLMLLCLSGPAVLAQGGSFAGSRQEMALRDLEATDNLLERAEQFVRSLSNPQVEVALVQARNIRDKAWEAYNAGYYDLARMVAARCRQQIQTILSAGRSSEQNETVVQRRLERAQDLLDKAREKVTDDPAAGSQPMYESARGMLDRAWEFYRNQQYLPAVKLAEQVIRIAERILRREHRRDRLEDNLARRLDMVRQTLEAARETVANCTNAQAAELLATAEQSLRMAEDLIDKGQYAAAARPLMQARNLADQAEELCEGSGTTRLEQRYERLVRLAEQLESEAAALPDGPKKSSLEQLLDQARLQLDLARARMGAGEAAQATAALQAATLALRQAENLLE